MCEAAMKYKYSVEEYLEMEANSLEKLEAKAQDQAERNILSINFSVRHEIQTLFDRLNFM